MSGGGDWGHVPPRFCSKQRSALYVLRKCPFFLKEKVPLKRRAPKFEMLSTSLHKIPVLRVHGDIV